MLKGYNLVGQTESAEGNQFLQAFSTVKQEFLPENFSIATVDETDKAVNKAVTAFALYKNSTAENRAIFLETIAEEIIAIGDELIQRAMLETGLTEARLIGERGRTTGQLKLFADLLREGSWIEAVIDTALPDRKPMPRADFRKMLVPIGPVVVFGASNFPFAFSTAGGDTAAALAAGNPVIVKAHASHLGTNELVALAINKAAQKCKMPDGVFSFVIGSGAVTGMQLVKHAGVKAVGFTGSYNAGMAIYKAAVNEREIPIPVYAEMSSINPVLLLPAKLKQDAIAVATQLAGSVTLGVGQFCTNPGLIFLIEDEASGAFIKKLTELLSAAPLATMLNAGICRSYYENRQTIAQQNGVTALFTGDDAGAAYKASAALLQVSAGDFISNPKLQNEIFGPASLIVKCKDKEELLLAIESLHGQLTGSVIADKNDMQNFSNCISVLTDKVGRVVYNGVPTGVEVCYAMVHGGPFPSTTDVRSTSVGADAVKRFVRPLCLQDCPAEFLPDVLKDENPLHIMRKVNGRYTNKSI
ncbi:MAG: aldehyde dehydrogenase (NADP(+)) [Aquabacterium sp.]|nr:aldehyde dehydrogenase (NADP(+)) [Ferruginibacter sp.]